MNKTRLAAAALFAVLTMACETEPLNVPDDSAPRFAVDGTALLNQDIAQVRASTARFHDVDVAMAEGYVPVSPCVGRPGIGGMGMHFMNVGLVMDADYALTMPEALLYEPQADGSLGLVGVEYIVVQDAWHGAGNNGRPSFRDREFDAMPPIGPNPATYTLHVWTWRPNPLGMFAEYNPTVVCPDAERHAH